jgi:hypothetical protein
MILGPCFGLFLKTRLHGDTFLDACGSLLEKFFDHARLVYVIERVDENRRKAKAA